MFLCQKLKDGNSITKFKCNATLTNFSTSLFQESGTYGLPCYLVPSVDLTFILILEGLYLKQR